MYNVRAIESVHWIQRMNTQNQNGADTYVRYVFAVAFMHHI